MENSGCQKLTKERQAEMTAEYKLSRKSVFFLYSAAGVSSTVSLCLPNLWSVQSSTSKLPRDECSHHNWASADFCPPVRAWCLVVFLSLLTHCWLRGSVSSHVKRKALLLWNTLLTHSSCWEFGQPKVFINLVAVHKHDLVNPDFFLTAIPWVMPQAWLK